MNLASLLADAPSHRTALAVGERTTTFDQLYERVACWRGALLGAGFGSGTRVAIIGGNDEVFVTGYLAAVTAGLVAVPLNPQSPANEIRRQLDAVHADVIIVGNAGLSVWQDIAEEQISAGVKAFVASELAAGSTELPAVLVPGLDGGPVKGIVDVAGHEPAILLFTSGTAGDPKPAVLTHDNLSSSLQSIQTVNAEFLAEPQVALGVIPLSHVFGINLLVNLALAAGMTMVLEDFASPARTAALVRRHSVTVMAGPPTLWAGLVRDGSVAAGDLASVELAVSGASRLEPSLAVQAQERLGIRIQEGYGLTETAGVVTSSMGTEAAIGSVGPLMPGVEVRLVDLSGQSVLIGDVGEVWVRGPMLSPGYWKFQDGRGVVEASSQTSDGWLMTGDLAVVDDDGCLAIMSRIKDLIIVSGFNVHPTEIETALLAHPSVESVGVRGEHDDMTGERVVAFVIAASGHQFDEAELLAHCRNELARYKVPKRIEPVLELPVSTIGKLRRHEL